MLYLYNKRSFNNSLHMKRRSTAVIACSNQTCTCTCIGQIVNRGAAELGNPLLFDLKCAVVAKSYFVCKLHYAGVCTWVLIAHTRVCIHVLTYVHTVSHVLP